MEKEKDFEKLLDINVDGNLSKAKALIPSLLYSYGEDENRIIDQIDVLSNKLRISESKVKSSIRLKYKRTKITLTETELKELIEASDKYEKIADYKKRLRKLNKMLRVAKLRMMTLVVKKDMLVNIGHNKRTIKKAKIRN